MYEEKQTFNVLKGTVPDFSTKDINLAFTIDDKTPSDVSFPNKEDGYIVEEVSCENDVTADWNNSTWSLENIENKGEAKKVKCTVAFKTSKGEPILNGADPVLGNGMIPVKIGEKGEVTKVKPESGEWYSYEDKQWANAVILTDGTEEPDVGATIEEKDIESYFVWIPKYKYRIFNLGNYTGYSVIDSNQVRRIELEFGLDNTEDGEYECETPMLDNGVQGASGESGTCDVGDWMTHPAFLAFGGSGFWVGKFETSSSLISTTSDAQSHNNANESQNVIIKPNTFSWRSISIGNAFKTSLAYKEDLQSHLMKNTEWGAIALLTQSIYGRCNGNQCTEIRINNTSNYVTGYSANKEATSGNGGYRDYEVVTPKSDGTKSVNYNNKESVNASTTGNYSGIYDMNGDCYEYVARAMTNVSDIKLADTSKIVWASSGLTEADLNNPKYYDIYILSTDTDYKGRILGDATGEMGPFQGINYGNNGERKVNSWYGDDGWNTNSKWPWLARGGHYDGGVNSGISAFAPCIPGEEGYKSFRITLAP